LYRPSLFLAVAACTGCALQTSTAPEDRARVDAALRYAWSVIQLYEADSGKTVVRFDSASLPEWLADYAAGPPEPGLRIRTPVPSDRRLRLVAEGPLVRAYGRDVVVVGLTKDGRTVLYAEATR
jgi:hypothetical protein